MEPWQSWVLLGVIGTGAAYYYTTTGQKKRARGRGPAVSESSHQSSSKTRNDSKDQRKRDKDKDNGSRENNTGTSLNNSTEGSGLEGPSKRKNKKKQKESLLQYPAVEVDVGQAQNSLEGNEDGVDNVEFAKQLSNAQTGTSLKKADGPGENKKAKRKGKQNNAASHTPNGNLQKSNGSINAPEMSRTSSTTGADADDDLSPAGSPELGATTATTSGPDVSDMLEQPSKGPSVLRLTEPQNPGSVREPKPKKAAPEPETKKQRQHRRKREEEKALREEGEQQRRVLLEKQLRTAREAEGRPAKNGLQPSTGMSSSPWNKQTASKAGSTVPTTEVNAQSLLDTLEDSRVGPSSGTVASNKPNTSTESSYENLPSEEEQLRILSELDSDSTWNTVEKGGKAKKKVSSTPKPSLSDKKISHTDTTPYVANGGQKAPISGENSTQTAISNGAQKPPALQKKVPDTVTELDGKLNSGELVPAGSGQSNLTMEQKREDTKDVRDESQHTPAVSQLEEGSTTSKGDIPETSEEAVGQNLQAVDVAEKTEQPESEESLENDNEAGKESLVSDGQSQPPDKQPTRKRYKYAWQHDEPEHSEMVARNHRIRKTLDRSIWNHGNIHEHPDYDGRWPYALIGHPKDSDWAAWDEDWMKYVKALSLVISLVC